METNCEHWPSEWNGYEKSITFELFSPVAHQAFFEIAKQFYDVKKTFLISSCMLINKACGCDILVSFSSKLIELAVRIIDSKKQFNIKDSKIAEFANYVFMEYHLFIKNLLRKYGVVYKVCWYIGVSWVKTLYDLWLGIKISPLNNNLCQRRYYKNVRRLFSTWDLSGILWTWLESGQSPSCHRLTINSQPFYYILYLILWILIN